MNNISKKKCIELAKIYISKYDCYPAAKGWTIDSAGCSKDRIYANWGNWSDFITELNIYTKVPNKPCSTVHKITIKKSNKCIYCMAVIKDINTYCSNKCQKAYERILLIQNFLNNEYVGKPLTTGSNSWVREYLYTIKGKSCEQCGVGAIYNNKKLLLEIDHIDGKCYNNTIDNMRFLCPNCHSQTSTYKNKNKISDNIKRY